MYSFFCCCCFLADTSFFLLFFYPLCCTKLTKLSLSTLQPGDDPLMAAVNLLEANWISVQEIFELVSLRSYVDVRRVVA
jgi:hypothetical protein